jgi:hypothetical protein
MADPIDYEQTEAEAAVLRSAAEEAMSRAGATGGALGGLLGGAAGGGVAGGAGGSAGGARGGASGGRLGVKLTRVHTAGEEVQTDLAPDAAAARVRESIAEHGTEIEDPNAAGDSSVWALVGAGAMNMNVALVRVVVEPSGGGSSVDLRASAREGRIGRKNTGAMAIERIAAALTN